MTDGLLRKRSLGALIQGLHDREVAATALAEEVVDAHEALGKELGAYRSFDADLVLQQAKEADRRLDTGDAGTLAGIPISVKDLYGVQGFDTWAGTAKKLPSRWESEGFLVGRLRSQGAVFTGKTHTVEMAFGGVGTNPHHGTPVNPWDADAHRVPGGSSSGAGVSLQEGSAVVALGTDTGGSIRIPASATGVVGQKTTAGLWGTSGVVPLSSTLDTVGALTRTVEDLAWFFFGVEKSSVSEASGAVAQLTARGLADLRIGVPECDHWRNCQTDIARCLEAALTELEAGGATLVPVPGVLLDRAVEPYLDGGVSAAECAEFLQAELSGWGDHLDPTVTRRIETGADRSAKHYIRTLRLRQVASEAFHAQFEDVDVLALPTLTLTPPVVEDLASPEAYGPVNRKMLSATCPANWLGGCALSLPVGMDRAGLPIGLQLVGPRHGDVGLLSAALAAERALGSGPERIGSPPRLTRDATSEA